MKTLKGEDVEHAPALPKKEGTIMIENKKIFFKGVIMLLLFMVVLIACF